MIIGVDHVQITIPRGEESKARAFYCDFLGLKEIPKPENRKKNGGFWLEAGFSQVHVGVEDGIDRGKTKVHVAYQVSDLELWKQKFQAAGFEFRDCAPFPNAQSFDFRDPFGNRVELIQENRK